MLKSTTEQKQPQGIGTKLGRRLRTFTLLLLPIALIGFYFYNRPFSCELSQVKVDTSHLTVAQKFNIERAAKKIDGIILKPGQQFSFNGSVGPRTPASGYLDAPTYVANGSASTAGGGICVVSSALYEAALLSNMPVKERAPHMKVMLSVKPGFDATVWYGGSDLKFTNNLTKPVEISCGTNEATQTLSVKIMGEQKSDADVRISSREFRGSDKTMAVEVYKETTVRGKSSQMLVSRDLYRTSFESTASHKANNASR